MTVQYSTAVRNARMNQLLSDMAVASSTSYIQIRTGAPPANCAAADTGTILAIINLPANFMTLAGAVASKAGTWSDASADAGGTMGHFRLKIADGTCIIQGTVGTSGTDMITDAATLTAGQVFNVLSFTITDSNA